MTEGNGSQYCVPVDELKQEIKSYSDKGFNSIGFLGGEPTIHPNIIDLISFAKDAGFNQIHLISNGRRFSDIGFVHALISAGVTRFSVSVHSHIPEIEDSLTRVRGGLDQKIKGLKNLAQCKKKGLIKNIISINIVINKLNYDTVTETIKFFRSLGFTDFRLNFMRPEGRALSNFDEIGVSFSECMPAIKRILDLSRIEGFDASLEGFPLCVLKGIDSPEQFAGEMRDQANKIVYFNKTGNDGKGPGRPELRKDVFSWDKRRKQELKVKGKECSLCRYDAACEGVWKGYVDRIGFGEFKPIVGDD